MENKTFTTALWSESLEELKDLGQTVQGTVSYKGSGGLDLEIPLGCLIDREPVNDVVVHGIEPINRTCVFGLSQDGKYYTLRDVTTPGPGFSAPGFEQETLSGRSMLVTHTPIEPNPIIDLLNIRLTGLREWVGRKPSSETSTFSESGDETTEFRIASEDIRDYTLFECEEAKVVIRYSGRRAGGPIPSYQFSYTDDYLLQIALPKGDVSLDEAIEGWCLPLWNFLSFCMGFRGSILSISFRTGGSHISGDYYLPLVDGVASPTDSMFCEMPIPFSSVEDDAQAYIFKWLSFKDYALQAANRTVSLTGNWQMPIDLLFLASANAFEASSRINAESKEMDKETFQKYLALIKKSISDEKVNRWAIGKLSTSNFVTATQLAKHLLKQLGEFSDYIVPDRKRFLYDHRVARNSYTHMTGISDSTILTDEDLYHHAKAVQLLTYGAVMLALGMEPERILTAFQASRYRWSDVYYARQMYARGHGGKSAQADNQASQRL